MSSEEKKRRSILHPFRSHKEPSKFEIIGRKKSPIVKQATTSSTFSAQPKQVSREQSRRLPSKPKPENPRPPEFYGNCLPSHDSLPRGSSSNAGDSSISIVNNFNQEKNQTIDPRISVKSPGSLSPYAKGFDFIRPAQSNNNPSQASFTKSETSGRQFNIADNTSPINEYNNTQSASSNWAKTRIALPTTKGVPPRKNPGDFGHFLSSDAINESHHRLAYGSMDPKFNVSYDSLAKSHTDHRDFDTGAPSIFSDDSMPPYRQRSAQQIYYPNSGSLQVPSTVADSKSFKPGHSPQSSQVSLSSASSAFRRKPPSDISPNRERSQSPHLSRVGEGAHDLTRNTSKIFETPGDITLPAGKNIPSPFTSPASSRSQSPRMSRVSEHNQSPKLSRVSEQSELPRFSGVAERNQLSQLNRIDEDRQPSEPEKGAEQLSDKDLLSTTDVSIRPALSILKRKPPQAIVLGSSPRASDVSTVSKSSRTGSYESANEVEMPHLLNRTSSRSSQQGTSAPPLLVRTTSKSSQQKGASLPHILTRTISRDSDNSSFGKSPDGIPSSVSPVLFKTNIHPRLLSNTAKLRLKSSIESKLNAEPIKLTPGEIQSRKSFDLDRSLLDPVSARSVPNSDPRRASTTSLHSLRGQKSYESFSKGKLPSVLEPVASSPPMSAIIPSSPQSDRQTVHYKSTSTLAPESHSKPNNSTPPLPLNVHASPSSSPSQSQPRSKNPFSTYGSSQEYGKPTASFENLSSYPHNDSSRMGFSAVLDTNSADFYDANDFFYSTSDSAQSDFKAPAAPNAHENYGYDNNSICESRSELQIEPIGDQKEQKNIFPSERSASSSKFSSAHSSMEVKPLNVNRKSQAIPSSNSSSANIYISPTASSYGKNHDRKISLSEELIRDVETFHHDVSSYQVNEDYTQDVSPVSPLNFTNQFDKESDSSNERTASRKVGEESYSDSPAQKLNSSNDAFEKTTAASSDEGKKDGHSLIENNDYFGGHLSRVSTEERGIEAQTQYTEDQFRTALLINDYDDDSSEELNIGTRQLKIVNPEPESESESESDSDPGPMMNKRTILSNNGSEIGHLRELETTAHRTVSGTDYFQGAVDEKEREGYENNVSSVHGQRAIINTSKTSSTPPEMDYGNSSSSELRFASFDNNESSVDNLRYEEKGSGDYSGSQGSRSRMSVNDAMSNRLAQSPERITYHNSLVSPSVNRGSGSIDCSYSGPEGGSLTSGVERENAIADFSFSTSTHPNFKYDSEQGFQGRSFRVVNNDLSDDDADENDGNDEINGREINDDDDSEKEPNRYLSKTPQRTFKVVNDGNYSDEDEDEDEDEDDDDFVGGGYDESNKIENDYSVVTQDVLSKSELDQDSMLSFTAKSPDKSISGYDQSTLSIGRFDANAGANIKDYKSNATQIVQNDSFDDPSITESSLESHSANFPNLQTNLQHMNVFSTQYDRKNEVAAPVPYLKTHIAKTGMNSTDIPTALRGNKSPLVSPLTTTPYNPIKEDVHERRRAHIPLKSSYVETLRIRAGTANCVVSSVSWGLPVGIAIQGVNVKKSGTVSSRQTSKKTGKPYNNSDLKHGKIKQRLLASEIEELEERSQFEKKGSDELERFMTQGSNNSYGGLSSPTQASMDISPKRTESGRSTNSHNYHVSYSAAASIGPNITGTTTNTTSSGSGNVTRSGTVISDRVSTTSNIVLGRSGTVLDRVGRNHGMTLFIANPDVDD